MWTQKYKKTIYHSVHPLTPGVIKVIFAVLSIKQYIFVENLDRIKNDYVITHSEDTTASWVRSKRHRCIKYYDNDLTWRRIFIHSISLLDAKTMIECMPWWWPCPVVHDTSLISVFWLILKGWLPKSDYVKTYFSLFKFIRYFNMLLLKIILLKLYLPSPCRHLSYLIDRLRKDHTIWRIDVTNTTGGGKFVVKLTGVKI